MYFSMIRLRQDIPLGNLAALTKHDGYQIHKLIWNLFSDHADRKRDFIYRHNPIGGWPAFYTVSRREPTDTSGMWVITSKKYFPKLRENQCLSFSLCVNPIRSKRDQNQRQHRHDVIMEAKLEHKHEGKNIILPSIVQEYGSSWLIERAESNGLSVSSGSIRADAYRQHRLFKGRSRQAIMYSTIEINGILTVTNPDLFIEKCLFNGIGPGKGFGCGLMLVKRI